MEVQVPLGILAGNQSFANLPLKGLSHCQSDAQHAAMQRPQHCLWQPDLWPHYTPGKFPPLHPVRRQNISLNPAAGLPVFLEPFEQADDVRLFKWLP